jgi:hypothetical protein
VGPDAATAVVAGVTVTVDRRSASPYPIPLFSPMTTFGVHGANSAGGGLMLVVDDLAIDRAP